MNKTEKQTWITAYKNCTTLEESQTITQQLKDKGLSLQDRLKIWNLAGGVSLLKNYRA
jgi:hypothetical protein